MNGARPLVSVLMAAHDHEAFVEDAIESVVAQTYDPVELLVLDDGSTDRTAETCSRAAKRHPCVRFDVQQNRGVSETLNRLLSWAEGEFIAFIGSDDMFEPEKVERQIDFLQRNPGVGAVFSFVNEMDDTGRIDEELTEKSGFNVHWTESGLIAAMLSGNRLCAPTCMMRRGLADEIGPMDPALPMVHDYDYWLKILAVSRIAIQPEHLTRYRRHPKNLSVVDPQRSNEQTWRVLERHLPILLPLYPDNYAHLRTIYLHVANLAYAAKSWPDAARFLREYCEWFGQGDEERMHLLIALVEMGSKQEARELAAEMMSRQIQLKPEIKALATRIHGWLQRGGQI